MNIEELAKSQSLDGKVAIVTGASRPNGQGRALSRALAIRGAELVMTDLPGDDPRYNFEGLGVGSADLLADAVAEVEALGTEATAVTADITDRAQIQRVVDSAVELFGGVDILVDNAGWFHGDFIERRTDEMWETSFRVNMKAPVDFAAEVVPHMRVRGGGSIVQNTSVAGIAAFAGRGVYSGTKHGAVGMMKVMADEFAGDNIRVNAICQGNVWTDISQRRSTESMTAPIATAARITAAAVASRDARGALGRAALAREIPITLCLGEASLHARARQLHQVGGIGEVPPEHAIGVGVVNGLAVG